MIKDPAPDEVFPAAEVIDGVGDGQAVDEFDVLVDGDQAEFHRFTGLQLPVFTGSLETDRSAVRHDGAGETGIYPRVGAFLHRHLGNMEFLDHAEPDPPAENGRSLTRILREFVLVPKNGFWQPRDILELPASVVGADEPPCG